MLITTHFRPCAMAPRRHLVLQPHPCLPSHRLTTRHHRHPPHLQDVFLPPWNQQTTAF